MTSTLALLVAVCTAWAEGSTSGSCGDNATWALSDDGLTLTISGSGAMGDYAPGNSDPRGLAPWASYLTQITSVVIGDEITSIGTYAFNNSDSGATIETVTIGSSVALIDTSAFGACNKLTSIELPASVETIRQMAFRYCSALETISFAEDSKLTTIGTNAFFLCTALKNIVIPNSVTSIGYALYGCTALESVTYGTGITSLSQYSFAYCSKLTTVILNGEITSIDQYAFVGCSSLASFEIPSTVTTIGEGAFKNCSALTALEIPESVTSIAASAYTGCSALASIKCDNDETAPTIDASTFDSSHYTNITLDASDIYRTATNWKAFYVTPTIATTAATITYGDDAVDFTSYVSGNTAEATITVTYTVGDETTETQPTNAGTYTVTIAAEQNSKSNYVDATVTLTINKASSAATLSNGSSYTITYGDDPVDIESDITNPGNAEITITYTDVDGNSTTEQPTDAGEYTIVITIAESDNYEADEITATLTINKAESTAASTEAEDGYTTTEGTPVSEDDIIADLVDVPENAEVTITYKYTGEDGEEIETDEQPTEPGEYTIVITIGETDNYDGTTIEVPLTITEDTTNSDPSTAISSVAAEGTTVSVSGGAIIITTAEVLQARVYSIAGAQVASQVVDGAATIDVPASGIYIVVLSDGTTAKVQVK